MTSTTRSGGPFPINLACSNHPSEIHAAEKLQRIFQSRRYNKNFLPFSRLILDWNFGVSSCHRVRELAVLLRR
jgi:hypothetical protein